MTQVDGSFPGARNGPVQPPRVRAMMDAYYSQRGIGVTLKAAMSASRKEAGAKHRPPPNSSPAVQAEIARLRQLAADVRIQLVSTTFLQKTLVTAHKHGDGRNACRIQLGDNAVELVAPTEADLRREDDDICRDLHSGSGKQHLPDVAAESEQPAWAFVQALGMVKADGVLLPNDKTYPFTAEVMDVVSTVVTTPVNLAKHFLDVRRPKTDPADPNRMCDALIFMPGHKSYPSGHATLAYGLWKVMGEVAGARDAVFKSVARDVAKRREAVGLHSKLDTAAGEDLGTAIGEWMVDMAAQTSEGDPFLPWAAMFVMAAQEW